MTLDLNINKVPLALGAEVSHQALVAAAFRRASLWRRLRRHHPAGQTIYDLDNCEFKGLDGALHIYPCNHSYLNHDRRWGTRATLFLKHGQLQRLLLQVIEGQTATLNFLDRFAAAVTATIGQPCQEGRYQTCWRGQGAHIKATLHPSETDADFDIALAPDLSHHPGG